MTVSPSIRAYRKTDRASVLRFIGLLQAHEVTLNDTRVEADGELCARYFEEIEARARRDGGAILIATANDRPVGFICYWVDQSDTILETADSNRCGYVSDLFVEEPWRSQHIARRLLNAATEHLMKDEGVKRLRICTLATNALAVSAYEGAGFDAYEITFEKRLR